MTTSVTTTPVGGAVRSSWTTFAAVVFGVGAVANLLWGWSAIADSADWGEFYPLADSAFVGPLEFWGWFSIVWALVLAAGTALLLRGHESGRVTGIVLAALSATFWLLAMPAFPLFAIAIMAMDIVILYGLIVHWEQHA